MKKVIASIYALCCAVMACSTSGGNETFEPYLQIRPESVEFDAKGGVADVQVLANFDYEIIPSVDWLSAEKDKSRAFWIKVTADASKVTEKRKGENAYKVKKSAVFRRQISLPPCYL